MTVKAILRQKGAGGVATMPGTASLKDCVAELAKRKIGALVVSADGDAIDGIISERDVVRVLAAQGAEALTLPLAEVMTRKVETCACEERSDALLARMTAGRFRHMPVVEDGKMVALVSIGDVVKYRLDELAHEKTALEDMIKGF